MSKLTARMSENGNYLEWSALDMGAAIPREAFPIILTALLEDAGAVKMRAIEGSPAADEKQYTVWKDIEPGFGVTLYVLPVPEDTA